VLSVGDFRELKAASLAMKAADKALRTDINRATVQVGNAIWRPLVAVHATKAMDTRVLAVGARVKGGNPPVAMAANSRRAIGGRLVPAKAYAAWEFGAAHRNAYSKYTRKSKNGRTHSVSRRTMTGLPPRTPKGRVVWPAFAEAAPRVVSLWVQMIVKKYYDASEGKS
jgi:hypothetical protein